MSDELLKHEYIYVPWVKSERKSELAVQIAVHLQQHYRAPLTVVVTRKPDVPDALSRWPSVSERSGYAEDGGVVLAYYPTYKVLEKIQHLEASVIVMLEWATDPQLGWARLHDAYNAVTGEVMHSGLTDDNRETLDRIVFEGYKGWHDDIAERMTLSWLEDLDQAAAYHRELVLAFARQTNSEPNIERLVKILYRFEASRASAR